MSPQLIIAALIAAAGFGTAWEVQDWRYGAKEKDRVEQALADQQRQATAAIQREQQVIAAQNKAETRARALRVDADGVRSALVGLSDATDAEMRAAAASHAACIERNATLAELFRTVARAGGELAEKADRHVNDAQKLIEASSQ